nr:YbgC/FadM family acyl-CoA thioesterase [Limosilactobacillus ingluviei]
MKQIHVAAAVIVNHGQILAGQRASGRLGEGAWEFPGGKIHPGEDPRETLQREIKEELGVAAVIGERVLPTIVHPYPWGEVHLQVFYARLRQTTLTPNAHDQFKWGTPQALADLAWLPAARPVLAALAKVDLSQLTIDDPAQLYTHTVEYYETDRMGITHHSNYVRWMEAARTRFLAAIGWDYRQFEARGIISPVVAVNCRYKHPTTFGDQVDIRLQVKQLDRIRLTLSYQMTCQGQIVCLGESEHCFTKDQQLLRLDRDLTDFAAALRQYQA